MRASAAVVVGWVLVAACVRVDEYRCGRDQDCNGGVGGRCEPDRHCSYAGASGCDRGYGAGAGPLTGTCIVDGGGDPDGDGDGVVDALDSCPMIANADQHDEDLDAIGDVCDNCPARVNAAQGNGDGDELGDACDPRDGGKPNRIAVFDPLTAASAAAWVSPSGAVVFANDGLVLNDTTLVDRAYALDDGDALAVEAAITIDETTSDRPATVAVMAPSQGLRFVACGIADDADGSPPYVALIEQGPVFEQTRLGNLGAFGEGTEVQVLYLPAVPPGSSVCQVGLDRSTPVGGSTPVANAPGGRVGFRAEGLRARARYLFGYSR